jgi:cytochrome c oxidase cbb3-type subunit II
MNIAPFIFIGLFATFSISWFGYVFKPQAELGRQEQFADPITAQIYPIARGGQAQQGAEVYRALNCAACHTQQVRGTNEGGALINDLQRGWGLRRTVGTDFLFEHPPQIGSVRLGPDLSNMGLRKNTNDVAWHYQHLLAPRSVVAKSNMPKYPFLFQKNKTGTSRSVLVFTDPDKKDVEFVPTEDCQALVAYLVSLKQVGSVFEAPAPMPKNAGTNAPVSGTNSAPATTTNAPGK